MQGKLTFQKLRNQAGDYINEEEIQIFALKSFLQCSKFTNFMFQT